MTAAHDPERWTSDREHVPTRVELEAEAEFRSTDARIGVDAEARFGADLAAGPPALIRYPRSAVRLFASTPAGSTVKRTLSSIRGAAWRVRRSVAPPPRSTPTVQISPAPADAVGAERLLAETTARHLVLIREGGELDPDALRLLGGLDEELRTASILYGDTRSRRGRITRAPEFSPLRLREEDYLGPVIVLDVARVRASGGFCAEAGSAPLLDLVLRAPTGTVRRIPGVLGVGDPIDLPSGAAEDAALAAVLHALDTAGDRAVVTTVSGRRVVDYEVAGAPVVSIVVPTRGGSGVVEGSTRVFVLEAVRSIVERTTWPHYEIVVVADDVTPQSVIDGLESIAGDRLRLTRWSEPFDFSAKIDRGAAASTGEYLLLLNDDVEVIAPDWLTLLLGVAQRPDVGIVSGALYFEGGAIQHLGHHYRRGGAGHIGFGIPAPPLNPPAALTVTREVSGVTAALMLVRSDTFAAVGGLSTVFPGNYNDVDVSLKVATADLWAVVVGRAALYHFESQTRDPRIRRTEILALHRRWSSLLQNDRYDPS